MTQENTPDINLEARRKRLIYRSNYRGFKEADILLGGFAAKFVPDMQADDLTELEALLEENDHNIYAWITKSAPLPAQFDTPLFARLQNYRP
ncbi:succinate dehydrogenase assembly factor 2 [Robiginitomaculum antarcticum]|uniref:succinate dehydrogenase assembly factor 2 n=1 Tax=Robiginitomaculum antarcticum TaxID=437507 RepID=UPI00038180F5|nr:succinate dehydrogenase assembly factor 2 [Robiginitomaculum antarcticum]